MKLRELCLLALCPLMAACGSSSDEPGTSQVTEYTAPPLSEDPPMSGADIDAINSEVQGKGQSSK